MAWNGMVLHRMASVAWDGMVLHGIASDCMVLHRMAKWHRMASVAWDGIEWHRMASNGIGWHRMAWDGMGVEFITHERSTIQNSVIQSIMLYLFYRYIAGYSLIISYFYRNIYMILHGTFTQDVTYIGHYVHKEYTDIMRLCGTPITVPLIWDTSQYVS